MCHGNLLKLYANKKSPVTFIYKTHLGNIEIKDKSNKKH